MTGMTGSTSYWCERAALPGGVRRSVRVLVADGHIRDVLPGVDARPDDVILRGIVLPGFANGHSHAFHRALRGRTHDDGGNFWTWRKAMYAVTHHLDPDTYRTLATAAFAEMVLAGFTVVGEFHYVHHAAGGRPYDDPNAMGAALLDAARAAGIRITLLDTCYLAGGLTAGGHVPLDDVQQRFSDGSVTAWAERVDLMADDATTRIGTAVHSVRAVPAHDLAAVGEFAARGGRPLHVHLSEQPAENEAALACYARTPTELLDEQGVLGPLTSAVHATHLTANDIAVLGRTGTTSCFCPTTERDLADGIGPARALSDAGSRLSLGSDQHAVIDLIEEARALEMHERLATLNRGRFYPTELLNAATRHDTLGWQDAGSLVVGARADLVAVRLDSVRTAGADPAQILLAATAADVDTVVVDGRTVVVGGRHRLGDVGDLLRRAIAPLWESARVPA
jgi:formiminoglutamate deiminase